MRILSNISNGLFEGVLIDDSEKKLLELTKLSEDELYRRIGQVGRENLSTFRPSDNYMIVPISVITPGNRPSSSGARRLKHLSRSTFP